MSLDDSVKVLKGSVIDGYGEMPFRYPCTEKYYPCEEENGLTWLEEHGICYIKEGLAHSIALTKNGKLFSWGNGSLGQLGLGDEKTMQQLMQIKSLNRQKIIQIACDDDYSMALNDKGHVYVWGKIDAFHALGLSHPVIKKPTKVKVLKQSIGSIALGDNIGFAIEKNGRIIHWNGNVSIKKQKTIVLTGNESNRIDRVIADNCSEHAHFISDDGCIYSYGSNEYGQLGIGNNVDFWKDKIVKVSFFEEQEKKIKNVCTGLHHSIALTEGGEIFGWGSNKLTQIGITDSDIIESSVPLRITTPGTPYKSWKTISCGYYCNRALNLRGDMYEWGYSQDRKDSMMMRDPLVTHDTIKYPLIKYPKSEEEFFVGFFMTRMALFYFYLPDHIRTGYLIPVPSSPKEQTNFSDVCITFHTISNQDVKRKHEDDTSDEGRKRARHK